MERLLEIGILLAAPWPLYRLLSIPVFRKSFFCFAVRVAFILAGYIVGVAVIAAYSPPLLRVAAIIALIGLIAERWRARPDYQTSNSVPPGSLSLVPRGPWTDLHFFENAAKRYGPIFKISHYFRPMVCFMGPRRGIALLSQFEDDLTTTPVRFNKFIPRGFLRYMARADHEKYKRIFQKALSKSVLAGTDTFMRAKVQDTLAEMAADQETGSRPQEALYEMLLAIFARLFFGIDDRTEAFKRLQKHYRGIDIKKASCGSVSREQETANQIAEIAAAQADEFRRRLTRGEKLPNCFLAELVSQQPSAEVDRTILLNLVYIVQAGRADMMGLLTWILKLLCDNQEWLSCVRDEKTKKSSAIAEGADSLSSRIVKEALRLEQSEFIFRRATKDIRFEGFLIPKGWNVRICIREGHRNPDIFGNPKKFDPDRFLAKAFSREEYSPLGMLRHSCLGARVVETMGEIFVSELARGYVCNSTQDGPREYGRAHWEPSSHFRVRISPIDQARAAEGVGQPHSV